MRPISDRARHRPICDDRRASCARAAARRPIRSCAIAWRHRGRSAESRPVVRALHSEERNEPPDIDVDFEHERREEVIQYVYNKYGRDHAGLTATVICYRRAARSAKSARYSGCRTIPSARSPDALGLVEGGVEGTRGAREPASIPTIRQLQQWCMAARRRNCSGFPRHLSQHVGGFVITRDPLDEVVPIENAAMESRTVIEWDKDDLDALGILKVDVLGARHADVPAARIRTAAIGITGYGHVRRSLTSTIPAEDPRGLRHDRNAPTRSAYFKSKAARRCRCCRG